MQWNIKTGAWVPEFVACSDVQGCLKKMSIICTKPTYSGLCSLIIHIKSPKYICFKIISNSWWDQAFVVHS